MEHRPIRLVSEQDALVGAKKGLYLIPLKDLSKIV